MRLTFAGVALFIQLAVIQVKRGANIELTLSGNYVNGNLVECNSNATLMCTAGAATNSMSWHRNGTKIGDCTAGFCLPDPSVSNIYGFVFDKPNGVFNISAEPVTNADANAIFECTIGSATKLLTLNVTGNFRILPSTKTVSSNITELNISTGCVDKNVVVQFHWSIINAFNQTDIKELPKSYQVLNSTSSCLSDLYCGGIDKEKKICILTIKEEENTADSYFIAVTVTYEQYPNKNREFQFKEGPFKITDKTETTTYSTVKLTPTPTIVITSTTTPVITPTQTIVISPTPTTVVSPTSTIVVSPTSTIMVASSSTDKTTSATEQNFPSIPKSNKSVIIAAVTGGVVILIIIISALVCYIKRKKRNKKKAKKYMFRKKESNVQENRL